MDNGLISSMVARFTEPLRRKLQLMISRAVVSAVNSEGGFQVVAVKGLQGEHRADLEHYEPYGFTSNPGKGGEGLLLSIGGDRSHSVVINIGQRKFRLKGLPDGDVAMFSQGQNHIIMRASGDAELVTPGNFTADVGKVMRFEADGIEFHARTYLQTDVHGKGKRETYTGGTAYQVDTYTTGATDASTEHGLDQPAIPSDI